jgi:hypothetical protein
MGGRQHHPFTGAQIYLLIPDQGVQMTIKPG